MSSLSVCASSVRLVFGGERLPPVDGRCAPAHSCLCMMWLGWVDGGVDGWHWCLCCGSESGVVERVQDAGCNHGTGCSMIGSAVGSPGIGRIHVPGSPQAQGDLAGRLPAPAMPPWGGHPVEFGVPPGPLVSFAGIALLA